MRLLDFFGWLALVIAFTIILRIGAKHPRARYLLIWAFIVRALFVLVHHYILPLPDSQADAVTFHRVAVQWAKNGFLGALGQFTTGAYLYSWVLSLIYSAIGPSVLAAQAINALFGTLIVWNVYRISSLLWGDKWAWRAGILASFFPTLVLYSAITMREVAIVYPLTLGVLWFTKSLQTNRPKYFLAAVGAFSVSTAFHTGIVVSLLLLPVAAYVRWLRDLLARNSSGVIKGAFYVSVIIAVIGGIFATGWGLNKIGPSAYADPLGWLAQKQASASRGRAAYLEWMQPHTMLDLCWQLPVRVLYFLFAPFPWMVQSSEDVLGLLISMLNLVLVLLLIRSLPKVLGNACARWQLWMLGGLVIVFALTTSNYGTSLRHVSKVVPLVLCLVRVPRIIIGQRKV